VWIWERTEIISLQKICKYFSNQCSPISERADISGRLPDFPPFYKLSLHPHTKPVTTVLRKYMNRTCGVFVVADTKSTPHLPSAATWYKPWRRVPFFGCWSALSIIFMVHPHACCRSERTTDVLRSAHVRPGHQDTSYGPHGPFAPELNLPGVVFEWPFGKQGIPNRGSNAGLPEV